jgi:hypothetical protein
MLTSLPIIENGCGSCTACCTVLGVKDLRKDDYTKCQHECAGGCGIYDSRPKECRTYECLWLASSNDAPEGLRPDKLGVILEVSELSIGMAVVVREVWQDASKSDLAQQYIYLVADEVQGFIYVIRPDNTRSAWFPPWAAHLAPLAEKFKEHGWRDMEKKTQNIAQRRAKQEKKRKNKLAKASRKRNR